jgi:menaquinone-dependent protoporphyrinogen oxidase
VRTSKITAVPETRRAAAPRRTDPAQLLRFRRGTVLAHAGSMTAAIFYATREGHTRKIAERMAVDLRARGATAEVFDVRTIETLDWSRYSAACVAASVHLGHHEPEMIAFVERHRTELTRLDAAFVSVSLSEAGAEDPTLTDAQRQAAAADAQRMIDVFVEDAGWRPDHVLAVAGALAYTKYNFLVRFMMKRIARKAGAPTDTSRDYEFTDWPALDRFVDALASRSGCAAR